MTDNEKLEKIYEYLDEEWKNAERLRAGLQRYDFPRDQYQKADFYASQVATIRDEIKAIGKNEI